MTIDGKKCNCNTVLPFKTQSLNDMEAQNDQFIMTDYSTIKNFPFMIEHTIQMANIWYDENFL